MNTRLTAAARRDLSEAAKWYRAREPGLDRRLFDAVDHALERIRELPEIGPEVEGRIRRVLLHTFPYALFYILDRDEIIVLGCLHGARDPSIVRNRDAG